MSKNKLIVIVAVLLVLLAVVAVTKGRDGGSEVEDPTEEEEAS